MVARRFAALGLLGLAAILLSLAYFGAKGIDQTLEQNRRIDAEFKTIADAIGSFEQRTNRLPSDAELYRILPYSDERRPLAIEVSNQFNQCDNRTDAFANFNSGYVIAIWRGHWWECFAPSNGMSTLGLSSLDYTADWAFLALVALLALRSIVAAIRLWRRTSE